MIIFNSKSQTLTLKLIPIQWRCLEQTQSVKLQQRAPGTAATLAVGIMCGF